MEEVLVEVGLAGEVVGAEVSAEAEAEVEEEVGLVGVIPMLGAGLGVVCLMVILTGDTDLVTHTMATIHGKGA